jgi:transcriptional regulator with AAA-type ATPase domain
VPYLKQKISVNKNNYIGIIEALQRFHIVSKLLTLVINLTMKPEQLLEFYLSNSANAFSILVLGERGVGKTHWVKKFAQQEPQTKLIVANCASFSNDTFAESELFGYKKGAFTGAEKDQIGLFQEAEGGILFLDEVHTLSQRVQEKLMTSLQTDGEGEHKGKFPIRRLGDSKVKYVGTKPLFASNQKLSELKKRLLPDFYDRISQLVVEFPSIHDSDVDIWSEFQKVYLAMEFEEFGSVPNSAELKSWLNRISLEGNYRTLQSIAINWHQAKLIEKTKLDKKDHDNFDPFTFVQSQHAKFHSSDSIVGDASLFNFRKGVSKEQLKLEYETALYDWAISKDGYGSVKEAEKGLKISRLKNPRKK